MSKYWSPVTHTLSPYVPGEQPSSPGVVKLNTNENPFGPSPKVLAAINKETGDQLRRYPAPNSAPLRQAIANHLGTHPEQIFLGNGSDEVLAHTFAAFFTGKGTLLFPDITYSFYPVYCGLYNIPCRPVPLTDQFEINIDDYNEPCGGIILANPNAPTGILLASDNVAKLAANHPDQVVVVDEAYMDFGGASFVPRLSEHPNVLVIQTLSKSRSLAGLRVGYAVGSTELINGLNRVKNSFNSYPIDRLAVAGAIAAMEDDAHFQFTTRAIIEQRDYLTGQLTARDFEVLPSATNFVFARPKKFPAKALFEALRQKEIYVRHFNQPRIDQFLRITIGTRAQLDALLDAIDTLEPVS